MTSIRQFPATHPLPDWRNLGVMLRVCLAVNLLGVCAVLVQAAEPAAWPERFLTLAARLEPVLMLSLALLALGRDALRRLPLRAAQAAALALAAGVAMALEGGMRPLFPAAVPLPYAGLLAALAGVAVLAYFEARSRLYSPALAEARLAALNARIRPHFLFNSLNAVLSLVRARPREAEAALESLADLFRAALRDPAELVRLSDEIALGRQYLALEQLRLGERLSVAWAVDAMPVDALIPPLLLQPLLENAIHHGIEPLPEGGVVRIAVSRSDSHILVAVDNPCAGGGQRGGGGHGMALANIRERLALYYDLEARLDVQAAPDHFSATLILPCR